MPILDAETSLYPADLLSQPVSSESERAWWAVYTKSRQEKAFARQLVGLNVPFYLPLVKKENIIRGRRKISLIPLFGGYVFMHGSGEERQLSLTTNRVSTIIPVENQSQIFAELSNIRTLIASDAPLTVEKLLKSGDRVRVKHGSMAGLEGIVVKRKGKSRLQIAVTMLQQGVSAEVDDFILEPI